jgi:O-antigen/teichoic acid export membrane protein
MMQLIFKILNSSLFKASGIYTLSSIINAAIPFLLLPILTRYLSPEEYGIVSMYALLLSITSVFTGLSVHGAINRAYFDEKINNHKEYIWNSLIILFISSSFTFLIYFFLGNYIFSLTGVPAYWVWTVVLVSFFQFVINCLLAIYQAQLLAFKYSKIQIGQSLVNVLLTILFVIILLLGWKGRLLAQILSVLFFGIMAFFILYKHYTEKKINLYYIKHALKFGVPLIPHTIGGMLMTLTDRFILNNLLGLEKVGIYMVGLQLGMVLALITESFNKAYAPWLFEKLNQNNEDIKRKIVMFTYIYFFGIIFFAYLIFFILKVLFPIFVGEKFLKAEKVILWILLGNAFGGMYFMVTNYIFYAYKSHILAIITFIVGILNVPITFYLVKLNGEVGAAQGFLIVNILSFLFTWVISAKVYPMNWRKGIFYAFHNK